MADVVGAAGIGLTAPPEGLLGLHGLIGPGVEVGTGEHAHIGHRRLLGHLPGHGWVGVGRIVTRAGRRSRGGRVTRDRQHELAGGRDQRDHGQEGDEEDAGTVRLTGWVMGRNLHAVPIGHGAWS